MVEGETLALHVTILPRGRQTVGARMSRFGEVFRAD